MFKVMKIKDHLYMPPIKKYEKYGAYPWKMTIQFLLIIFTTCQVFFIVNENTTYTYSQYTIFNKFFLNPDASGGDGGLTNTFTLFSRKELTNFLQSTINNYYSISNIAIDNYEYYYDGELRKPPKLLVSFVDNEEALKKGFKFEYKLSDSDLGPFTTSKADEFYDNIQEFYVTFALKHKLDKYQKTPRNCYVWKLKQRYNFSHHGSIIVELSTDNYSCESRNYNVAKHYVWLSLGTMILGAGYFFLTIRDITNRANLITDVQISKNKLQGVWSTLDLRSKLKFFNYWVILSIFGNLFQIFGGVLTLFDNETYITNHQKIIGFGCFFAWVGIVRFIDHRSVAYSIVHTLERSIKIIAFYVFGVVPIFMGFAFLGICYFWETGIYYSTPMSLIANYALVNGDSVYAFSFAGYQQNKFFGQLYFYMFIVFFICCVHNLFIAIVEQSFSSFREERMNAKSSSSDEEHETSGIMSPKQKNIELKEKKKQSSKAFKKILNAGRVESGSAFDESTLRLIQQMDNLVNEIISKLGTLESLSNGSVRFTSQVEELKEHLNLLITKHIEPILEYLK